MRLRQRQRRAFRLALLCVLCFCTILSAANRKKSHPKAKPVENNSAVGRVTDVRFWSTAETTRIAIELTSEFQLKSDRLQNPDRLFFDIVGVKPPASYSTMETINVGDAFIKQIRVAETQPGTTRIVLDLNSPADFTASQLSNPERLMIELRGAAPVSLDPPIQPRIQAKLTSQTSVLNGMPPPPAPPEGIRKEIVAVTLPALTTSKVPLASTALAAKRTASGEASLTRVLGLKLGKVVIDAGHGGQDAGTAGPSGLLEKDLVLDVARRLGVLVESRLGSEVVYTRSGDTFVPLETRTRIANDTKADLFISIHANSSPVKGISGVETYYLNFTASKNALDVAARENAGSEHSISDLKDLLEKIALKDKLDESREFASKVQSPLAALSSKTNSSSKDRGVKKAPFVVLIGASMPSILIEIGFVTNAHDESMMKKPEYRQKIAEALYRGVSGYASGLSHFQVALPKQVAQRKNSTE